MNWDVLARTLESAFVRPALRQAEGTILVAAEPFDLRQALLAVTETEEERERLDSEGASDVIDTHWPLKALLAFEWDSAGPISWFADLSSLDRGSSREYVCLFLEAWQEAGEEPLRPIAAIEPRDNPALLSTFFRSLLRENGTSYVSRGLFGSLPSRTRNYVPDMIPAEVVKETYWEWMEWASRIELASWVDLQDSVLRQAIDPNPLIPWGELLAGLRPSEHVRPEDMIRAYLRAYRAEEEALSADDRRRTLEIYFAQAYRTG